MKIDLKEQSKKGKLNLRDAIHGLITAIVTSLLTSVVTSVGAGQIDVKQAGITAGVAGATFLLARVGTGEKNNDEKSSK